MLIGKEMRQAYDRLVARGKPYKVALFAVMRMLLCRLEGVAMDYRARSKAEQSAPPSSLPLPLHPPSCPPYNPLNGKR